VFLLYDTDGDSGDWVYWHNMLGWVDLESAQLFDDATRALDGEWLYVGDNGELAPYASLILDMLTIMERHVQINLDSYAGRAMLAIDIAKGLASSHENCDFAFINEAIYEKGYALFIPGMPFS